MDGIARDEDASRPGEFSWIAPTELGGYIVRADGENPDLLAQELLRLRETATELERQVEESRRAMQRLGVRDEVTRALAESSSLVEAAPRPFPVGSRRQHRGRHSSWRRISWATKTSSA
jgi:hypothetical protein